MMTPSVKTTDKPVTPPVLRPKPPQPADEARSTAAEAVAPALRITGLDAYYGATHAIGDVTLEIPKGMVTAIIGPSGCGKSTLLRCVNRMHELIEGVRTHGEMRVNGDSIYAPAVDVIELRKRMGMVLDRKSVV